jgi:general secretion pathway protein J
MKTLRALPASSRSRGFTLLELLVAMFIAAIIFAMGYGAINQGVKNRIQLQEQQGRLLELQTAVRIIEQDFVQLAPRPVRQPVGNDYYPALMTSVNSGSSSVSVRSSFSDTAGTSSAAVQGSATVPFVMLTRAGWTNPSGLQRTGLQRVAYFLDNGTLRREYYPVLDPTQSSKTVRRDLLTHLKSVSLRFYSQGNIWGTQWPLSTRSTDYDTRPIAVEITLDTEQWGKIIRVMEISG